MDRALDNERYDRQMMVWGNEGQDLLRDSHVCVMHFDQDSVVTECIKSLVLVGVGRISVVGAELKSDFFSWTTMEDMNPSVDLVSVSCDECMQWEARDWCAFSLVISLSANCELLQGTLKRWEHTSSSSRLPNLILAYADGSSMYCSLVGNEYHCVVESHSNTIPDLRLASMWRELEEYHRSFDLFRMPKEELSNVPYSVLLGVVRKKLVESGDSISRKRVKDALFDLHDQLLGGPLSQDLNFVEAERYAFLLTVDSTSIPDNLAEIFRLLDEKPHSRLNSWFYDVSHAVKCFIEENRCVPVSGAMADMESSTALFNRQKIIYESKAKEHLEQLMGLLDDKAIPAGYVKRFIENLKGLTAIKLAKLPFALTDTTNPCFIKLVNKQQSLQATVPPTSALSAMCGALISQEAIKLLNHRYIPIENTLIYNGGNYESEILKF